MEYTKGPWTLKDTGGEFFIPEINISFLRSHSTNKKEDEGIRKSEQGQIEQANARLMVAAPEIYEALKEVEYSTVLDLDGDYISCCPICDVWAGEEHKDYCEIGNALSKAEGRTSR